MCVRSHTAVLRPGRASCRRRHPGVRNAKRAEEVSARKEHSIANFTIFHRVHSSLRSSSHISCVLAVDAEPGCLILGDILAPVPLAVACSDSGNLLHPRMPVSNGSMWACYGSVICSYSPVMYFFFFSSTGFNSPSLVA